MQADAQASGFFEIPRKHLLARIFQRVVVAYS